MPDPEDLKSGECIFLSTSPLRFPLSTHPTPDTHKLTQSPQNHYWVWLRTLQVVLYEVQTINNSKLKFAYVVVNFSSQVIFLFLLFWGMVMYANEVETKEKEKLPEIKN